MDLLSKLVGKSIGEVANGVASAVDRFVETPEEKKASKILLMKIQQEPNKWQAEINKIEASHRTIFVAGWRPAIGWICACALGWGWVLAPIVETVLKIYNVQVTMPNIDVAQAISLVMALLGMSAIRTYDKKNGLSK